jgi:hypothetical protein
MNQYDGYNGPDLAPKHVDPEEFWCLTIRGGREYRGPFRTSSEAKAAAMEMIEETRGIGPAPNIKVVKTVATSFTATVYDTKWTGFE